MLDLNDLYYFASVVKHAGFSAASRALDIPKSSLSRAVDRLEEQVGIRLLERSTRSVIPTELGLEFYQRCLNMIAEANAAEETAARRHGAPRGTIRVSCPPGLAQAVLADALPTFLHAYPEVRVDMRVSNRRLDLIEERIDVAVRVRSRLDTDANLIMRTLAHSPFILVASPAFIAKAGQPAIVEDLQRLPFLSMGQQAGPHTWQLITADGRTASIVQEPRLYTSDLNVLLGAAIQGVGVAILPDIVCHGPIRDGRLLHILPDWRTQDEIVHLVFASRRGLLPAVRAFIDFVVQVFTDKSAGL
jgi:DNA-binding transcriptional LysR family regulator